MKSPGLSPAPSGGGERESKPRDLSPGLLDVLDSVGAIGKNRQAQVGGACLAGRYTANHLGSILNRLV